MLENVDKADVDWSSVVGISGVPREYCWHDGLDRRQPQRMLGYAWEQPLAQPLQLI